MGEAASFFELWKVGAPRSLPLPETSVRDNRSDGETPNAGPG